MVLFVVVWWWSWQWRIKGALGTIAYAPCFSRVGMWGPAVLELVLEVCCGVEVLVEFGHRLTGTSPAPQGVCVGGGGSGSEVGGSGG